MTESRHEAVAAPAVPVVLELGGPLGPLADPGHRLHSATAERVGVELSALFRQLGVPSRPAIDLRELPEASRRGRRYLALHVNGRPCRYPDELPVLVAEYVRGERSGARATTASVFDWCSALLEAANADEPPPSPLVEFVGLMSLEIVKARPGVALGDTHALAYLSSMSPDGSRSAPSDAVEALRRVLDLKISIADREAVAKALEAGPCEVDELVETLVSSLRIDLVEVRMPRAYLEQLTTAGGEEDEGKFEFLRDGLFVELGLHYPAFRFVSDETLKPYTFASTVNHVRLLPRVGLTADECLINRAPEADDGPELEVLGVTRNPATGRHATVVPLTARKQAEASGLTTWNDLDFLVLSLSADLRQASACFVHEAGVEDALDRLSWAFPAVVSTARSEVPNALATITRCVRALVAERVSVRNLRMLLQELVELVHADAITIDAVAFAESPTPSDVALSAEDWLRLALARQIQHQASRGTNTVVAYLLDPAIEHEVLSETREPRAGGEPPTEDRADAILNAVRAELDWLEGEYPDALVPDILTSLAARRPLRQILADEFPRLSVFAHEELREVNVQPIARISLGEA